MSSDNEKNIVWPYSGVLRDARLAEEVDMWRRVERLEVSAAYIEADRDIDFLNSLEARGPRLQLDYQKAELLLQEHRLTQTNRCDRCLWLNASSRAKGRAGKFPVRSGGRLSGRLMTMR